MSDIGNRLRLARESKDLKQLDVSQQLNINNKTLSSYERGTTLPDIETIQALAKFYEVSLMWLLDATCDNDNAYAYPDILKQIEGLSKEDIKLLREFLSFLEFRKHTH